MTQFMSPGPPGQIVHKAKRYNFLYQKFSPPTYKHQLIEGDEANY
jgi:hypothetical protein